MAYILKVYMQKASSTIGVFCISSTNMLLRLVFLLAFTFSFFAQIRVPSCDRGFSGLRAGDGRSS